jgi:hypothetical protein
MKPIIGNIVFLFGAGASKGAEHVTPDTPPLMYQLYDRLALRFPTEWGPSSTRAPHADRYRENFEKAFTEIDLGRAPGIPPGTPLPGLNAIEAQRPLAVYFSEFQLDLSRCDFYSRLLDFLRRSGLIEDCFFSTLNYDCLFEQAAIRTGFRLDYLLDAASAMLSATAGENWPGARASSDLVYLAKLHGSCTFNTPDEEWLRVMLSGGNTFVDPNMHVSDLFTPLTEKAAEQMFPIMTQMTSPDRYNFLGGTRLFQFRQIWALAIHNAALIVVIGAAPRQYDDHILGPLQGATGNIVYIGSGRDAAAWRECNPRFQQIGTTFDEGFRTLLTLLALLKRRFGGSLSDCIHNA